MMRDSSPPTTLDSIKKKVKNEPFFDYRLYRLYRLWEAYRLSRLQGSTTPATIDYGSLTTLKRLSTIDYERILGRFSRKSQKIVRKRTKNRSESGGTGKNWEFMGSAPASGPGFLISHMLYFPARYAGFLASGGRGCTLIRVYSQERLKRHLNGLKRAPVFGWVFSGVAAWPGVVPGCSITGFKLFSRCRCISSYTGQLQPFKMGLACLIRSGRVKNSGV